MIEFLRVILGILHLASPIIAFILIAGIISEESKHRRKYLWLMTILAFISAYIIITKFDRIDLGYEGMGKIFVPFRYSAWVIITFSVYVIIYNFFFRKRKGCIALTIFLIIFTLPFNPLFKRGTVSYHQEVAFWSNVIENETTNLSLDEYRRMLKRKRTHEWLSFKFKNANDGRYSPELLTIFYRLGFSTLQVSNVDPSLINEFIHKCKISENESNCDFSDISKNSNLSDDAFNYVLEHNNVQYYFGSMAYCARNNIERLKKLQDSLQLPKRIKWGDEGIEQENRRIEKYFTSLNASGE